MMKYDKPSMYMQGLAHALADTAPKTVDGNSIQQVATCMHLVLETLIYHQTHPNEKNIKNSWSLFIAFATSLGIDHKAADDALEHLKDARLYETIFATEAYDLGWFSHIYSTLEETRRKLRTLYSSYPGRALPEPCKKQLHVFREAFSDKDELKEVQDCINRLMTSLMIASVRDGMSPALLHYLEQFVRSYVVRDFVTPMQTVDVIELLGGYDENCTAYRFLMQITEFHELLKTHRENQSIQDLLVSTQKVLDKAELYANIATYLRWRVRHIAAGRSSLLQKSETPKVEE